MVNLLFNICLYFSTPHTTLFNLHHLSSLFENFSTFFRSTKRYTISHKIKLYTCWVVDDKDEDEVNPIHGGQAIFNRWTCSSVHVGLVLPSLKCLRIFFCTFFNLMYLLFMSLFQSDNKMFNLILFLFKCSTSLIN